MQRTISSPGTQSRQSLGTNTDSKWFPLLRNKLFTFVSLDHIQNSGAGGYTRDVFTASERNPANWFFSDTGEHSGQPGFYSVSDRSISSDTCSGAIRVVHARLSQVVSTGAKRLFGRLDWNRSSDNMLARWHTRAKFLITKTSSSAKRQSRTTNNRTLATLGHTSSIPKLLENSGTVSDYERH